MGCRLLNGGLLLLLCGHGVSGLGLSRWGLLHRRRLGNRWVLGSREALDHSVIIVFGHLFKQKVGCHFFIFVAGNVGSQRSLSVKSELFQTLDRLHLLFGHLNSLLSGAGLSLATSSGHASHATHAGLTSTEEQLHEHHRICLNLLIHGWLLLLEHRHEFLVEVGILCESRPDLSKLRTVHEGLQASRLATAHTGATHVSTLAASRVSLRGSLLRNASGHEFKGKVGLPTGSLQGTDALVSARARKGHQILHFFLVNGRGSGLRLSLGGLNGRGLHWLNTLGVFLRLDGNSG